MKIALLSDIHGNWEALESAVQDAHRRQINQFIVLGDSVGYGANPRECFDWVKDNASINLMGNHEKAVVDPKLRSWFNPMAREAILWTETLFGPKEKEVIMQLPYIATKGNLVFSHGSLHEPEAFHYLTTFDDTQPTFQKMDGPVCFSGHTHVPYCFCLQDQSSDYLKPGIQTLDKNKKYILNPGSVGQPRDGDSRLSYGIFDDKKWIFEIVRLEYNKEKAAAKIRKAGLPKYLADRLL